MTLNVLAVDDSSTVRAIIAKTLRLSGFEVARFGEAAQGEEALQMIRGERFDLVFCDLNMPGMSGYDLIETLHREGLLGSLAVVVVSSIGGSAAIDGLKSKGVRGYLRKPLRPEELRTVVNRVMGGAHELRA